MERTKGKIGKTGFPERIVVKYGKYENYFFIEEYPQAVEFAKSNNGILILQIQFEGKYI